MRVVVTGKRGQLAQALIEQSGRHGVEVVLLGRPEFDLLDVPQGAHLIREIRPDAIVSAAAYTAVDKAEHDRATARAVNGEAPGLLAAEAARLGIPIVHLSTDYVFDGRKGAPYVEEDEPNPLGSYGMSKLLGETRVAAANSNHAILRTAWVYSPFGNNFLKTMLRLAGDRSEVRVVDDQYGNPTSAHNLAEAVLVAVRNLVRSRDIALRGTFHVAGAGAATWADFASEIFLVSRDAGGPIATVARIGTAEYPSVAPRPENSCLLCEKFASVHGLALPDWRVSAREVVRSLVHTTRVMQRGDI